MCVSAAENAGDRGASLSQPAADGSPAGRFSFPSAILRGGSSPSAILRAAFPLPVILRTAFPLPVILRSFAPKNLLGRCF